MPRLYHVKIEYEAVVLADSEQEALEFADEIVANERVSFVDADEINLYSRPVFPLEWVPDCCVYHKGKEDITLRKAIEIVKEEIARSLPGQGVIPEPNKAVIPERPAPRLQRGIKPSSVNTSQPEEDP